MPAPMQGEMQPTVYRFKLGGFEVATIMDSKVIRSGLTPSFGGEAHADEVKALAKANRIEADRYEHPFTPMIVNTGSELVLFDTGNGTLREEHEQLRARLPAGHLVARLALAGYKPEDIDVVVDHARPSRSYRRADQRRRAGVFQGALRVRRRRFRFLEEGRERARGAQVQPRALCEDLPAAGRASTFIKPGDTVVPGITAVDAFGHSPGLLAFHIESEGKRLLNWADTCGHYVVSLQRPDLHLDVDDDKEKAVATRKRILDMVSNEGLCVAGFHMPFPGLGFVEKAGGAYRWVPHGYQLNLNLFRARSSRAAAQRCALRALCDSINSVRCAIASASAALRRASSEASASCAMARSSRAGDQARKAAPTAFSRVKCTGGAPRFIAHSMQSPPSTASFILCRFATWRMAAETIAAGEEPPARALPNSLSTKRVSPAKVASITPSSARSEASDTTASTSASSTVFLSAA